MLKLILSFSLIAAAAQPPARRSVALLDYVAGDYGRAIGPDGTVLSPTEHQEQIGFVQDAARELRADTGAAGEELAARIDALAVLVSARAPPAKVAAQARELREAIAGRFGVVLLPPRAPDLAAGERAYGQSCAACHGAAGHPNLALGLPTKPADLGIEEEVKGLSPQRAFNIVTYGIPGTAMPAWDEGIDEPRRWDLAFYVLTLSKGPATAKGLELARAALVPTGYPELSALSDEQLEERLAAAKLPAADRALSLSALRRGPFKEPPKIAMGLGLAQKGVQKAVELAHAGDKQGARRELISSYLDHFEPREAGLRARDGELVRQIETAFLGLRTAIEEGQPAESAAARLDALLEKADAQAAGGGFVAFVGALAIALREGVEAALLVGAMLAFLRKAGRQRDARAVHAGAVAALAAGGAAWWASGALLLQLSGGQRELVEGVLQLVTAALLLYASHWLLAALSAKRLVSFLSAKTMAAGSAMVILGLTFLAVFREMFEVVLFFRGLLLESPSAGKQVAAGAATGLFLLALLVAIFQRVGKRLRPRPLLVTCGVLLCGLAILMVGNGIRALQVLGALPLTVWGRFEIPALGVYATREGLLAQLFVLAALIASALFSARERNDGGPEQRGTAAAQAS